MTIETNKFTSLLYADESGRNASAFLPKIDKSVFGDLHIDQIIDEIARGYEEYGLEAYYARKPAHRGEAEYRLAVTRDLWDDGVRGAFTGFLAGFSLARRYLKTSVSTHASPNKEKWKLDAAVEYVKTIDAIRGYAGKPVMSAGLTRFLEWAKEYAATEKYMTLRESALALNAKIDAISYSIEIDIANNMVVYGVDGADGDTGDVCGDLTATFGRYDLESVNRDIVAFADVNMNALELRLQEALLSEHKALGPALADFHSKHGDIIHENILTFEKEAHFYISYIVYSKNLEKKGFPFAIPSFSDDGTLDVRGGYDASLALLKNSADQIVENDFQIFKGERSFLLTGPNQGGKTTFSRMLGQNIFFAGLGLPVPCREAKIPWAGAIKTHFNVAENPGDDTGRLKEELTRLKAILSSTPYGGVVILNELFSSATALDAVEMAARVIRLFEKKDCVCLYITHLHDLTGTGGVVCLAAGMTEGVAPACSYKITRSGSKTNSLAGRLLAGRKLRSADIKEKIYGH